MRADIDKLSAWTPTKFWFRYKHRNSRHYARAFAAGKEKWTSLKTNLLSVAKNRMRSSTGASATTIKCALDAVRQILDIAVAASHLYANPALNDSLRRVILLKS